jgi:hypothetical protein
MKQAVIIDVLSTSAHHSRKHELVGEIITVRNTYEFDVFERITGKVGYVSLYYTNSKGQDGCIYGCKIDYEGVKPVWEL